MSKKVILGVILISVIVGALGAVGNLVSSGQNTPNYTLMNQTTLPLTLNLLGDGAKWAANNGSLALFVNWKDNWLAHHLTDGSEWGPWPNESEIDNSRFSIYQTLSQSGLNVEFAGDIPENLSRYDVVVIEAYWSVEPRHELLVRNYVLNGGGVVLLGGVPPFFGGYCKDWWTYRVGLKDLSPIQEWFGGGYYNCADGYVEIMVDNPFGTDLLRGDMLFEGVGDYASINLLHNDTQIIAQWQNQLEYRRGTFAFTHEYGQGRVYYQSAVEILPLSVISYRNEYVFAVESNSTISALEFRAENSQLAFTVTGPNGTRGYIKVTVAKSLVSEIEGVEIKLNDESVDYTAESTGDSWILFFTYQHSTHRVTINLGRATAPFAGIPIEDVTIVILSVVIVICVGVLYVNIKKDRNSARKSSYRLVN